jgi:hypothetical protein
MCFTWPDLKYRVEKVHWASKYLSAVRNSNIVWNSRYAVSHFNGVLILAWRAIPLNRPQKAVYLIFK